MKKIFLINGETTQVSDIDFIFLSGYDWTLNYKGYVVCSSRVGGLHSQFMSRVIAKRAKIDCSNQIDHIDRDRLNNQRENLRPATNSQNRANSKINKDNVSGYKGVYQRKRKWRAVIQFQSEKIHLGYFNSPEEASEAYQKAADYYFNEFANS